MNRGEKKEFVVIGEWESEVRTRRDRFTHQTPILQILFNEHYKQPHVAASRQFIVDALQDRDKNLYDVVA